MAKKILILGVAIIMALGLFAGCSGKATLSGEQITQVKQSAFELYSQEMPQLTVEEISFYYYGTFNGNIVVMFWPDSGGRQAWDDIFDIHYPNTNFIQVWSNGVFYRLDEAQDQELLTTNDIKQIAKIHKKETNNIYHNKDTWL